MVLKCKRYKEKEKIENNKRKKKKKEKGFWTEQPSPIQFLWPINLTRTGIFSLTLSPSDRWSPPIGSIFSTVFSPSPETAGRYPACPAHSRNAPPL
jgi:hypothetical protein